MAGPAAEGKGPRGLPDRLRLRVSTPERLLVDEEVAAVVVPGAAGRFGVLPGHTPLLAQLGTGELEFRSSGGETRWVAVSEGHVEALPDRVTVLAEVAEEPQAIDLGRAEEALKRARERLESRSRDLDLERARAAVHRAVTRIQVGRRAAGD